MIYKIEIWDEDVPILKLETGKWRKFPPIKKQIKTYLEEQKAFILEFCEHYNVGTKKFNWKDWEEIYIYKLTRE